MHTEKLRTRTIRNLTRIETEERTSGDSHGNALENGLWRKDLLLSRQWLRRRRWYWQPLRSESSWSRPMSCLSMASSTSMPLPQNTLHATDEDEASHPPPTFTGRSVTFHRSSLFPSLSLSLSLYLSEEIQDSLWRCELAFMLLGPVSLSGYPLNGSHVSRVGFFLDYWNFVGFPARNLFPLRLIPFPNPTSPDI